ncbi:hypothetical protein BH10PSE17_BH10PSE17_14660 [soil metagenome]
MSTPTQSTPSTHVLHAVDSPGDNVQRLTLRSIAIFEAVKGAAALAACLGLLGLLHRDLHQLAITLIGHLGLDPEAHFPSIFLRYVDVVENTNLRTIFLIGTAYAAIRFSEAAGLWYQRVWGEWIGALSGALYVPFELHHLILRPTLGSAVVLGSNVLVVLYLAWRLWRRKRAAR